jgi:hypothetical protein
MIRVSGEFKIESRDLVWRCLDFLKANHIGVGLLQPTDEPFEMAALIPLTLYEIIFMAK